MTRVEGWEKKLKLVIEKHNELPSQYGVSDCYIIPDDAVEAVIGETMYENARKYTTPKGALRKLKEHGFLTVEEAFAAKFPEIPVTLAQRGDIGVVYQDNGEISGGVFTGIGFMTRDDVRVVFLPVSRVTRAFKVG